MNNFSMDWFKSKKREEELQQLMLDQQRLRNELLMKELEEAKKNNSDEYDEEDDWLNDDDCCNDDDEYKEGRYSLDEEYVPYTKPYMHLKMVNDILTVVLQDGNIVTKPNATQEDYKAVTLATSEAQIFNIVMSQDVKAEKDKRDADIERVKALFEGMELLNKFSDFNVIGSSIYLKGISRSLPQLLVEEFIMILSSYHKHYSVQQIEDLLLDDEKYQSFKRFFMWCCLNPRAEVAHELYRFLKDNSFRITKQGFFVALRNVVSLCDDTALVDFVSNSYNKIKAIWKRDPSNYNVWRDKNDFLFLQDFNYQPTEDMTNAGNLTDLYLELPEMKSNRYTDDWTKTFDIRVGRPVNMPISDCNWSTQDCAAAGLHFTADQIHYVGCGDTSMLILINPMKVVGIGTAKGRCYEYLPIMTVPREEATTILHDLDFDTIGLDDEYAIRELQGLAERAQAGFVAESRKYDFNIPNVSDAEIKGIAASLEDMMGEIVDRIMTID